MITYQLVEGGCQFRSMHSILAAHFESSGYPAIAGVAQEGQFLHPGSFMCPRYQRKKKARKSKASKKKKKDSKKKKKKKGQDLDVDWWG